MSFQKNNKYNEVIDLIRLSKFDDVIKILCSLKKQYLNDPIFYNLLGFAYDSISKVEDAKKNYIKSLEFDANFYEAKFNLAVLNYKTFNYVEAEKLFNELIRLYKNDYNSYYNLGIIKYDQKKYEESISYFTLACKIKHDFYASYHHLAMSYEQLKIFEKAIFFYNKANEFNKEKVLFSYNNLGNVFLNLKDYSKAIEYFNKALEFHGNKALVYNNLGIANFEIGNIDEAIKFFEGAIALDDQNIKYYSTLLSVIPFKKEEISYYNKYAKKFRSSIKLFNKNLIDDIPHEKNSKIKIGFLSSDFKKHPTGYYLLDLIISLYKKNVFELYAFSDSNYFDEYTRQLKNHFHSWQNVDHLNDLQLINLIRNHGINILIDMQGHTYGNRLQIFANKPAPVQLSWASYLASTGIPEIDYIIADPYVVPLKEENNYTEKIWRLPNIWNVLSTSDIKNLDTSQTPAIKNQFITFGCFNNINKINDNVIKVWSNILNKIYGSKLFLKSDKFIISSLKENLYKKFENNGVNRVNLIFEISSERYDLLKNYNKIDIALDTFPYSGGTTSLELSWMCVPLLTMVGDRFISRCGGSINHNLQMTNWIAFNEEDYVNKAIEFTQDIKKLEIIRNNLRINSRKSCLFNIDLFSKDFVNAINQIWKIYLNK